MDKNKGSATSLEPNSDSRILAGVFEYLLSGAAPWLLLITGRASENISGLILRCAMDASPNAQLAVPPKVCHRCLLTFVPPIS